jgi:hypothetical protein
LSLSLSSLGNPSNLTDFFIPSAVSDFGSGAAESSASASTSISSAFHLPPLDLPAGFFAQALDASSPPSSPVRLQISDSMKKKRLLVAQATPAKKSPKVDPVTARYIAIKDQLEACSLIYMETSCTLRWIGNGEYSDCYRIVAPNQMSGYVVKAFHETRINRSPSDLKAMAEHSTNQFRQLKALGVGVADILNIDTAVRDCFMIVEFVPFEINPVSWFRRSLEELDANQKSLLGKVKQLFEIAVNHNLSLDLLPSNLRQKDSGELVVTDFCEEPFDEDAFDVEISTRLKKWSGHRSLQRFLMENLTDSFKAIHKEAISSSDFQGK